ncbi:DNA alkylation repair protein [Falsigemmobacter faecalis]|uniref:DNA alkylation repair protein n=1 Tax=Falsigemmobacter faecalis TaxID=2488730 RepID=A0A3P3DE70_9RHOB|nr:DNA alkylation repair protein [Falsigemmobacter faecalis]RRH72605.1 DNA alkylation repair protein [Falsigemmobacter faecalis]
MLAEDALEHLKTLGDVQKAAEAAAWHKVDRPYLGIAPAAIDALAREWRQSLPLDARLALADGLWQSGVHDAMMAAAKLLEQARIRPSDDEAFALILAWLPGVEGAALADQLAVAGAKRLLADPARVEALEAFITAENRWSRRAAFLMLSPWAKMNNPKDADLVIRDRALAWAETLISDRNWFIQKAVSGWIADLSRHDADRARAFIAKHGAALKSYALKESGRFLQN